MAKYWVFQNNQVNGPHDPDDLSQLSGFSAESLVCPEGRKGTNMGDWQRASMVPELSVSLLKASQLAVAMKGAATGGSMFGGLPPEPTLKDLAALGSLQEKVSLLDSTVGQLQENLRLKEQELLSVHRELEEKSRHAQELAVKLGGVEERLSAVGTLREGLDKAMSAEQELEQTIHRQASTIDELTRQLEALRQDKVQLESASAEKAGKADLEALRSELEELKSRPAPAPAPAPAAASPFDAPKPASFEPPKPSVFDAPKPGLFEPPAGGLAAPPDAPLSAPSLAPAPASSLPDLSGASPAPAPLGLSEPPAPAAQPFGGLSLAEPPATFTPSTPSSSGFPDAGAPLSPFGGGGFEAPTAASLQPAPMPFNAGAPEPALASAAPSSMTGDLAAPPKKSGAGKLVLVLFMLAAVGGGAAFKLGLLGGKPAPVSEPLPPPMAEAPKVPSPEEQAETLKQQAVELVRTWPAGASTLGAMLETPSVQAGGLSPWQADRVKDGLYQVNFYSPKSSGGTGQTYEFEADLALRRVTARNEAAVAALNGGKKTSVASKRKPRIKPKPSDDAPMLQDLLSVESAERGPERQAQPEPSPKPSAPSEPGMAGLLDGPELSVKPSAQSTARRPGARKKAAAPEESQVPQESLDDLLKGAREPRRRGGKEEETLDQILLPGIPRRGQDLDEPVAEAARRAAGADEGPAEESAPAPRKAAPKKRPAGQPADADLLDDLLKP